MKKILDIVSNNKYSTECWTKWKMSIIQTLPDYQKWLSTHLNVYATDLDLVFYGDRVDIHHSTYFSEILNIEEVNLKSIKPNKLVNYIINQINEGYYCVFFCAVNKTVYHEVFVYGYDDIKKVFYTIALNDGFKEKLFSFREIKTDYAKMLKSYLKDPLKFKGYRRFGYLFSRAKINHSYKNSDIFPDFSYKLMNEAWGSKIIFSYGEGFETYFYYGIECIAPLKNKMLELYNYGIESFSEKETNYTRISFFKLLEHRKNILESMKWIIDLWKINDSDITNCMLDYSNSVKTFNIYFNKYVKYQETKNVNILKDIIDKIDSVKLTERNIIVNFDKMIREYYYANIFDSESYPQII